MANLILFNKPFGVLSQFSRTREAHPTLADHIQEKSTRKFYPAGRLDRDSEGLLLLTNDGKLQSIISQPRHKWLKKYWVQVEGTISDQAIASLQSGVELKDGLTLPAQVRQIPPPPVWPRTQPVRFRKNVADCWIELAIREGKNRQVRRMTAAVGYPTLRLIRHTVGMYTLQTLLPGQYKMLSHRHDPESCGKPDSERSE